MDGFCFRAGLILSVFLCLQLPIFAANEFPQYSPAQNPAFQLTDSSKTHAVFVYEPQKNSKNPVLRVSESVYIGIPPSTIHQLELNQWQINKTKSDGALIESISGSLSTAGLNAREIERMLQPGVQVQRHEFQELDILQITFSFPQNIEISNASNSYQRDKLVAERLQYRVTWRPRGSFIPSPQTNHTYGYGKIFPNLVLNGTDTVHLRGKRRLPEPEKTEGFNPFSSGYHETGELVNRIHDNENKISPNTDAARVSIRKKGVAAVRPHDLEAQGIDPSTLKLDQVQVWHKGQEISISVLDNNQDNSFDTGDAIYFYGQESNSMFTNDNPYYITWKTPASSPKRAKKIPKEEFASSLAVHTAKITINDNRILGMESTDKGKWFYAQLDEQDSAFPIELPQIVNAGTIEFTLSWMNKNKSATGITAQIGDVSRSFSVGINDVTTTTFHIPASEFITNSTLHLHLHQKPLPYTTENGSVKKNVVPQLFLDEIHVRYQKKSSPTASTLVLLPDSLSTVKLQSATDTIVTAWVIHNHEITHSMQPDTPLTEITLPNTPRDRVEIYPAGEIPGPHTIDQDYPSSLHRKDQGYDYIIIAYHTLLDEARRLAAIREQDGFKVLLTDVQDIYDEFNYGFPANDPIKRFLRYAQSEWEGVSPEFVLLIGESSWDHRNFEGHNTIDQIPSYTPLEDPQHYASDDWYAYLWNEDDRAFSDVMVGRISVSTPEEVKKYIDKVITYEEDSPVGLWKGRNLFISDDNFWMYSYKSSESSITEKLSPSFINQNEFLHETSPYLYKTFHNHPVETVRNEYSNKKISSTATLALLDALNESALITQYYGHGGAQLWSHERLFYGTDRSTSNILELQPTNKFPFILNWSCLTGYLNINISPFNICLAEEFLRYDDRGAIAVWAPSENGHTDQHELMSHYVVRNLIQDGLTRFGEATTLTKAEYLLTRNGSKDIELMEQYILFGDPGIQLAVPAETLTLTETLIQLLPNQENNISFQTTSQTVQSGKAVVSLSIKGENIYESQPIEITNGFIQHVWNQTIDHDSNEDTATLRVYAWDEQNNTDAWGGVHIPLLNPILSMGEGVVSITNEPHTAYFELSNPSQFPVSGLECVFTIGDKSEVIAVDEIAPLSNKVIMWQGTIPDDVNVLYAEMIPPADIPVLFKKDQTKIAFTVPRKYEDHISPLLGLLTIAPGEAVQNTTLRMQIPFQNVSTAHPVSATTYLQGPGSATSPKTLTLDAEQQRQLVYSITPPEIGNLDYTLLVETGTQQTEYPLQLEVLDKPDLALAEGDVTVLPETPIIGKTVLFKTHIYNMGESTARNVAIAAYDGDPGNNIKLTSFRSSHTTSIPEIAPGEIKEIEILWDPIAYDGLGVHEIYFVVDPYNRIEELSEDNNVSTFSMSLSGLPDLTVNYWSDHHIKIDTANNRIPVWGEPMTLSARVRNVGDTDAAYIRVSYLHNQDEHTSFIDHIRTNTSSETQIEIPLLAARHTLVVHADKYNLIGEKNEITEEDNNISREKRLYVQLQMPKTKIINNIRKYKVTNETQFDAGMAEHVVYEPHKKSLTMPPLVDKAILHLSPVYVENPENYDTQSANTLWQWNIKFNSFLSPINADTELRFKVPAINGTFDVYAQIYTTNPEKDATGTIQVKAAGEIDYRTIDYENNTDPKSYRKIGTYSIRDDYFTIEFKAVPGGFASTIGDIKFIHNTEENSPVSTGYLSPYFPAANAAGNPTAIRWDADIPAGTELSVKARWLNRVADGTTRFFPWGRVMDGKKGELKVMGRGDFLQYYVEFKKPVDLEDSPSISNITISIPSKNE